jgi:hypothetical protein
MINAAVPIEAYDMGSVDDDQRKAMIERDWKERGKHLYAANWHDLFSATPADRRNELTWKRRFESVTLRAHNFYSPGEDVVANTTTDSASIFWTVLRQGFHLSRGAWAAQELVKGVSWMTSLADFVMIRRQAGWKRDLWYFGVPETEISKIDLMTQPFFNDFIENDLVDANPVIASAKAGEKKVQFDLLARGLPALSYAAAANPVTALGNTRNFNMELNGRTENRWPTEGHSGDNTGNWLHSDFRNVALPYVYQMYEAMIIKGSLQ